MVGENFAYNSDTLPTVFIRCDQGFRIALLNQLSGTIKYMGEDALVYTDNSVYIASGRDDSKWVKYLGPSSYEIDQAHYENCDGLVVLSRGCVYDVADEGSGPVIDWPMVACDVDHLYNTFSYVSNGMVYAREIDEDFVEIGQACPTTLL
jgi:hypothetical protein